MAIRKIARMGHPVLRGRADEVADPEAPEIRMLIHDMLETMLDADGLGIAAPQVYEARRVVMFFVPQEETQESSEEPSGPGPDEEDNEQPERELVVLINPAIETLSDETEDGWEGCLSVPGLRGIVARPNAVRYTGLAPDGSSVERDAQGMHARVVQHECDHLDGVLYPQRMDDMSLLTFESEWKHFEAIAQDDDSD